jgi:anti-sigma factor RsiW
MGCEWRVKLDGYVDGELSPEELAECEQHLRDCRQCATAVLGCLQMKQAIRSAATSRYAPTPELRLRIRQTISPALPRPRRFWVPQFSLAAAALVPLLVSAAVWLTRPQPANLARELLDQHVATLASPNPVDVLSSDRHTVKPWFEGRLPFAFNLPDLQGSPFRLIGGRVTYLQQSPGAHLLFGIRKHQISVFILRDRGLCRQLGHFYPETRESGFTIDTWSQDGLCYALVGDTLPGDINALGQLLQAAAPR